MELVGDYLLLRAKYFKYVYSKKGDVRLVENSVSYMLNRLIFN